MTERLMAAAVTPFWFVSASGFAFWTAVHFIRRPWEFLS